MSFRQRFGAADVKLIASERVFDGYFSVDRLRARHRSFSGDWCEPVTREVFQRGNAVGVLPYDPDSDSLILIEQFRAGCVNRGHSPWMLELVAGIIEDGEGDEDVVRREALEEAGCELGELQPIASFYPSAGACSEHVSLYCGRVTQAAVGEVRGLQSEGEDILVHRLSREEVMQLLMENRIDNGHTLVALQWLALNVERLREQWCGAGTTFPV